MMLIQDVLWFSASLGTPLKAHALLLAIRCLLLLTSDFGFVCLSGNLCLSLVRAIGHFPGCTCTTCHLFLAAIFLHLLLVFWMSLRSRLVSLHLCTFGLLSLVSHLCLTLLFAIGWLHFILHVAVHSCVHFIFSRFPLGPVRCSLSMLLLIAVMQFAGGNLFAWLTPHFA